MKHPSGNIVKITVMLGLITLWRYLVGCEFISHCLEDTVLKFLQKKLVMSGAS